MDRNQINKLPRTVPYRTTSRLPYRNLYCALLRLASNIITRDFGNRTNIETQTAETWRIDYLISAHGLAKDIGAEDGLEKIICRTRQLRRKEKRAAMRYNGSCFERDSDPDCGVLKTITLISCRASTMDPYHAVVLKGIRIRIVEF